jgi:hypothetical protein
MDAMPAPPSPAAIQEDVMSERTSLADTDHVSSDAGLIEFKVRTRLVEYGDGNKFAEYRILFFKDGYVAGVEDGPRRETVARSDALKAARQRVAILKSHRLYAIQVTRKHIEDGEARSCNTCAVAQALWHNQDRMRLPRSQYRFALEPYGFFSSVRGIVLSRKFSSVDDQVLPVKLLPDLAPARTKENFHPESMVEWAMQFDDWAESRGMSLKEWRSERGYQKDDYPCRPAPASFVLDLDAFKPESAHD